MGHGSMKENAKVTVKVKDTESKGEQKKAQLTWHEFSKHHNCSLENHHRNCNSHYILNFLLRVISVIEITQIKESNRKMHIFSRRVADLR